MKRTMKSLFAVTALILSLCVGVQAQTHSVTITWTDPITGALYIVNRVPCTGTFTPSGSNPNVGTCSQDGTPVTVVTTTSVNATTATDTTVVGGTAYDYYLQSTCTGTGAACPSPYTGAGAGAHSNEVAVLIPPTLPPAPTIGITSVAENITGTTETITAQWIDTTGPNMEDYFAFANGSVFLNQGLVTSPTNTFAEVYTGPVQPQNFFIVCNAFGTCVSEQVVARDPTDGPLTKNLLYGLQHEKQS